LAILPGSYLLDPPQMLFFGHFGHF